MVYINGESNKEKDRSKERPWEVRFGGMTLGGAVNDAFYLAAEFQARCGDTPLTMLFGIDMGRFSDDYPEDKYCIHAYRVRFNDNSDIGVLVKGSNAWEALAKPYELEWVKEFDGFLFEDIRKAIGKIDYKTSGFGGILVIESREDLEHTIEMIAEHAKYCEALWGTYGNENAVRAKGLRPVFEFTGNKEIRTKWHGAI